MNGVKALARGLAALAVLPIRVSLALRALVVGYALHLAGLGARVRPLHEVRYGRPSLALDLMEEFRSVLADSVVLSLLNNRRVTLEDFDDSEGFPRLRKEAWPKFLRAWEERLNERVQHPLLRKRLAYREILLAQARILVKHLLGELPRYEPFAVR